MLAPIAMATGPAKDVAGKGYNGYIFMERAVQFIQVGDHAVAQP